MKVARILLCTSFLLVAVLSAGVSSAHYTPVAGDQFAYDERVTVGNGVGDYGGYSDLTVTNGSIAVTSVLPNGTESAFYYNSNTYTSSQGAHQSWNSEGRFTFSADTFLYVQGTDNQTGYTNPSVWFFMDNSLAPGATFYVLNTQMTVVANSYSYPLDTASGTYVTTIYAEGNGSYLRDDSYGLFDATYNWKAFFDPSTGYIVGYVYTEQDTNSSGDGFTLTDTLGVTHTSYPLTPGAAPPSNSTGSGGPTVSGTLIVIAGVVVVVVVIVVVVFAVLRSRRRISLPTHSATGRISYAPPPMGPPPPGVHLTPSDQPAVQQIIIKETVKVKCQYCGSLIDSTAEKCPFCGATRT